MDVDPEVSIEGLTLWHKSGGRSGIWERNSHEVGISRTDTGPASRKRDRRTTKPAGVALAGVDQAVRPTSRRRTSRRRTSRRRTMPARKCDSSHLHVQGSSSVASASVSADLCRRCAWVCHLGDMSTSTSSGRARLGFGRALVTGGGLVCAARSSRRAARPQPPKAATKPSGPVDVLSAGSLQDLMQDQIGPGVPPSDGIYAQRRLHGIRLHWPAASRAGTLQGDVFISASPAVNASLEGSSNGNWVSWYAQFASSPLVLGYNPNSKFAQALKSKPWYEVISEPGFRLGRTDPATDPKGVLADDALDQAATEVQPP